MDDDKTMTGTESPDEIRVALERARALSAGKDYTNKKAMAAALAQIPGHPLHTLTRENEALLALIAGAKPVIGAGENAEKLLKQIHGFTSHYAKKGDLLYPMLKVKYHIDGPSDLLWTEDDEIRDAFKVLLRRITLGKEWRQEMLDVLGRVEQMAKKENEILFPLCAVNFSEEDWREIERDLRDYGECLGVSTESRDAEDSSAPAEPAWAEGEIVMPGGKLTLAQLRALLNTLPMEITFVDAENINRYFNEGPKVFKRPATALGREVFSCHPPKIEALVRKVIEDFRAGKRDVVPIWSEKNGRAILTRYMAVRSPEGEYLGTLELVEDVQAAKERFRNN